MESKSRWEAQDPRAGQGAQVLRVDGMAMKWESRGGGNRIWGWGWGDMGFESGEHILKAGRGSIFNHVGNAAVPAELLWAWGLCSSRLLLLKWQQKGAVLKLPPWECCQGTDCAGLRGSCTAPHNLACRLGTPLVHPLLSYWFVAAYLKSRFDLSWCRYILLEN